jgi:polyisoprenoid-binding protein YceI
VNDAFVTTGLTRPPRSATLLCIGRHAASRQQAIPMRLLRFVLPIALAGAPFLAQAADAVAYRIDPQHSKVVFNVDHNGYSRTFGFLHVKEGTIVFDADDWSKSSVDATVDLASVDMGDDEVTKAVRGSSLLDSDRAPTAHYVSDSVEKRGDDEGVVHGKLTLRGITLPLDIPFRVNRVGKTIYGLHTVAGFSSSLSIDRTTYGMTSNQHSIGTVASVWLEIEAIRGGSANPNQQGKESSDAPAQ